MRLDLPTFSQLFQMHINVDTLETYDRNVSAAWPERTERGDHERWSWTAKSTLWHKRYHLDVYPDRIEFHAEISGDGAIDVIRFFDSIPDQHFREHAIRTRHLVDRGHTPAREYSIGSETAFRHVFSPEPNYHGRKIFRSFEYGLISVTGDSDYCGGNLIANPGPLCFAVAADPAREWLAMGLAVRPGEYLFSDYEYLGGGDFALAVTNWGARRVEGTFVTPKMVLTTGATAEHAIAGYVSALREAGLVSQPQREQPGWWSRPVICGWGHQCYQADLFRIRSSTERPPDNAAYTLCTQANYRDIVELADSHDLPWGTLIIDARWFLSGGLKDVDVGRWPNLRGFIEQQHRRGKRVLLWWGPWDPEGIPADECIRYLPSEHLGRANSPGRRAKTPLGNLSLRGLAPGTKLSIDISLDSVRKRIRDQVRYLLSPSGLNADGLKIDHISATPGCYGMVFPEGSGRVFGIEAAHAYLALLHETAKEVKPDALLSGQSPNPYLADFQDMIRISPWPYFSDSVTAEATHSTAMARIVDDTWLIDTNGYPMPSLAAFREYMDLQPSLGVPSLLYITHLDTTGEAITAEDYARIRRAWERL